MSASLVNRSLKNIRNELEFLKESNVISGDIFELINSKLPEKWDGNQRSPQNADTEEYVEALYDFEAQQDGDLSLKTGDKIQVLEKISPDWYRGKSNNKIGIFPANYVKPAFTRSASPKSAEAASSSTVSLPVFTSIIRTSRITVSFTAGFSTLCTSSRLYASSASTATAGAFTISSTFH